MLPLVSPEKKSSAPIALPGTPEWSSYTTNQVGADTDAFVTATAKPAGCGEATVMLPEEPSVEPPKSTPLVVLPPVVAPELLEVSVIAVEDAVEDVVVCRDALIPQPMSAPTIRPATKIPMYTPALEEDSGTLFDTLGLLFAGAVGVLFAAGFAFCADAAGCDHDNVGF